MHVVKYLATGSVVALMAAFSMGANAQDNEGVNGTGGEECTGVECVPGGNVDRDRGSRTEDGNRKQRSRDGDRTKDGTREERRVNRKDDDGKEDEKRRVNRNDDNDRAGNKREARRGDWKYDSNRHQRHRNKDSRFRYYYGGYWYAEPYWTLPVYGVGRVSCGEGRAIVDDNGFNRVRTIECSGGTYTYAARRQGDAYRVSLNSRTGEIVRVRPM